MPFKEILCALSYLIPLVICYVFVIQSNTWMSRGNYGNAALGPFEMAFVAIAAFVPGLNIGIVLYLFGSVYPRRRAYWDSYQMVLDGGFPTGEDRLPKPPPRGADYDPDLDLD